MTERTCGCNRIPPTGVATGETRVEIARSEISVTRRVSPRAARCDTLIVVPIRIALVAGVVGLALGGCARESLDWECPAVATGDLVVTELRGEQSGSDNTSISP